jgi:hypothetical protein
MYHSVGAASYCRIVGSDYRRGFDIDIGFVDHLQVVTTSNYNTITFSTRYKIMPAVSSLVVTW